MNKRRKKEISNSIIRKIKNIIYSRFNLNNENVFSELYANWLYMKKQSIIKADLYRYKDEISSFSGYGFNRSVIFSQKVRIIPPGEEVWQDI